MVEESTQDDPLDFALGDGTLPAALEQKLLGFKEGMRANFTIAAGEETFGTRDLQRVQRVALSEFPDEIPPQVGAIHAFHLPNGMEVAGTIVAVEEDEIVVDFNPPLAGRDFVFDVTVLKVTERA